MEASITSPLFAKQLLALFHTQPPFSCLGCHSVARLEYCVQIGIYRNALHTHYGVCCTLDIEVSNVHYSPECALIGHCNEYCAHPVNYYEYSVNVLKSLTYVIHSLVLRPLLDFISQPWRKISTAARLNLGLGTRLCDTSNQCITSDKNEVKA